MSDVIYEVPPSPVVVNGVHRFGPLAKLATALAKAQGEIEDAAKDSTNPHFKSRYADLAAVRAAIREPLSRNGIAYVQLVRRQNNAVEIETILMHAESGECIGDTLSMPLAQATPQAVGSCISYGRRYSLMSIVGLAADDDDGEGAHGRQSAGNGKPINPDTGRPVNPRSSAQAKKRGEWEAFTDDLLGADNAAQVDGVKRHWLSRDDLPAKWREQIEEEAEKRIAELTAGNLKGALQDSVSLEDLREQGKAHAEDGMHQLETWWKSLTADEKLLLKDTGAMDGLKNIANEVDMQRAGV